ncbi:zona pellucida sperm-binding protein 3-like [Acipenser oxyrinchus oxyrinchus]|uniref:Zona pellucida sperm-binding protein 3 n=1 Tax=Acipenser oxyrinchus oxyrinchus TaxID=40147 RepID=A0AAD8CVB2_ACIOX|nr:zona pellucida sperm-binding protein 3-like [Acipenser oxyrinchus oxyrinchus]
MGTRSVQTALSLALILLVQLHGAFGWNWPDQQVYNPVLFNAPRAVFQAKPTPDTVQRADLSLLNSVTLDCRKDAMVVTVNRDLFGIGYLVNSADLSVGSAGCSATSSDSVTNTVVFSIQLQDCGSTFQVTLRVDRICYCANISCIPVFLNRMPVMHEITYKDVVFISFRRWNVSSSPIKPTWVPFTSTASTEQILDFSLLLMNDNWSGPRVSNVIYLGDILHVEASVAVDNHVPLRLYVDNCIATLSDNKDSEARYAVVDKLGCLMDSKSPDSSSFIRPALNKLHFDITAFKFQGDSRSMIYMTCTLRAVNADKPADASNKASLLSKYKPCKAPDVLWVSEDGSSAVCGCCDAGSCSGTPRFLTGPLPPADINQPNWSGKWLHKRAAPLDPAGQDPQVHVKEITIGPMTVVHVVRDHAVVLSKESLYHPLQLVEEVQDSGSSVPVLAVSAVALALSCAVLLAVFPEEVLPV